MTFFGAHNHKSVIFGVLEKSRDTPRIFGDTPMSRDTQFGIH